MVLYTGVAMYGFLFATTTSTFFIAYVLHTVVAGTFFTGTASVGQRLFPKAKFAQFASANGIIIGICSMILPPALGVFIENMGRNYRYVFLLGCLLAAASTVSFFIVLLKFKQLGGDTAYVPPE
jgi:hypothetical protein